VKKSELSYEQITLLILFLISLVFILGMFKFLLIPLVSEKTKQEVCRIALVKSQEDGLINQLIKFSTKAVCNGIKEKEVVVSSDYDVLSNLVLYLKKSCDITKSGIDNLVSTDKLCFYTIKFKSDRTINVDCNLIKKLLSANIPTEKKPLYQYCNFPNLVVNLKCGSYLTINPDSDLIVKICYVHKEDGKATFYLE